MRKRTLVIAALISTAAGSLVDAQDTPAAVAVGPWRTGVAVACPSGRTIPANTAISGPNVTAAELCGSASSSTGGTSTGGALVSNTGNTAQDLLTNSVNLFIVSKTTNPLVSGFMQGAATGFISSMFANNAEAQRQQQLMAQEILRRNQELAEQRRIAAQQRFDAMFARLSGELKLEGLPFNLSLKAMSSYTPDNLQLKRMSSSGPGDLKLKIGDSSPAAYGLKGLPGIYVGGPEGGDTAASNQASPGNGVPDAPGTNPSRASGTDSGTTGPGIPGLPGIYLAGVQPSQAAQLAEAAQTLTGPEKTVSEDTALHAAQNNPGLTAPSQDPQVQNFQHADQDYQQALATNVEAKQNYETAQAHVDSDQIAIERARSQLNAITPSAQQQAAFNQMLGAAKNDEEASMIARQNFDSTDVHLSASRDRAAQALAQTSTAPAAAVDLRGTNSITVASLKTPAGNGFPITAAPAVFLPKASPSVSATLPTQSQLRARLEGMQGSLRRLMEDEARRGETRADAVKDVNEAVADAEERGADMLLDLFLTGWDHCAPGVQGGVKGYFERRLQDVYKEASIAKPTANLGAFNEHAEWLERSISQIDRYKNLLTNLHSTADTKKILEHSDGDLKDSLEGLGKTLEMGLDDDKIRDLLNLSECGAVTVKAASSAIDSVYDIFKEGDAAVTLRRTDENTAQFLSAEKSLDRQIKRTVAQLNCYKRPDADGVVSCLETVGRL